MINKKNLKVQDIKKKPFAVRLYPHHIEALKKICKKKKITQSQYFADKIGEDIDTLKILKEYYGN